MVALVALVLFAAPVAQEPAVAATAVVPHGADLGAKEDFHRGPWVEVGLGVFSAFGGSSRPASEPFLGITLGHELGERVALLASLGLGAARGRCSDAVGPAACGGWSALGAFFAEGGFSFGLPVAERTLVGVKVVGGLTELSPSPLQEGGRLSGFHVGSGVSVDYRTHLEHFSVGVDALVRYTFARPPSGGGPTQSFGLASLALVPRLRYVF